jgi:hypothetical protein
LGHTTADPKEPGVLFGLPDMINDNCRLDLNHLLLGIIHIYWNDLQCISFLTLLAGGNLSISPKSIPNARNLKITMAEVDEKDSAKFRRLRCCCGGYGPLSDRFGHPDQHSSSSFIWFLSRFFATNPTAKIR